MVLPATFCLKKNIFVSTIDCVQAFKVFAVGLVKKL